MTDSFDELVSEAQSCTLCPNMTERTAVLSTLNGSRTPRVLFIAEAPGRKGADRTRIPMTGDASGIAFQKLLDSIELRREEIFITNAVMCSPRSETGANRKPSTAEIVNCNPFLRRTIEILDPPVIATLGSVALAALQRIEPHGISLKEGVGKPVPWLRRLLVPLYHPSPQVTISMRPLAVQLEDYRALALALEGARR